MTLARLSVVVPARDEERRLPLLLDRFRDDADAIFEAAGFEIAELLVVDDHSSDRTPELAAAAAAADPRIRVLRSEGGAGKGAAVRTGILAASSPWALLTDVDLATPLEEIAELARAAADGADIAIGSRALPASEIRVHQPWHRELAGQAFNVVVRAATALPFRDTQCGFKLFRLAAARPLFERQRTNGFAFDVEILAAADARGLCVAEVPIRWSNDAQTRVRFVGASVGMALELARIAVRHRSRSGARQRPAPGVERVKHPGEEGARP